MPSFTGEVFTRPDCSDRIVDAVAAGRQLLLYGTGDGADKLIRRLAALGASPDGFFVSPEFARGQTFHGQPVQTFDEALKSRRDPLVLLAFATARREVIAQIEAVARQAELLIPDLPVAGETVFDRAFAAAHRDEIERAHALFADERSREVYSFLLLYKLSGELAPLLASAERDYDPFSLLPTDRFRRCLDGGAYDGDTARALLDAASNVTEIVCAEPDERNHRRLLAYRDCETRATITPLQVALSDQPGTASLFASGNRNSSLFRASHTARAERVQTETIDRIIGETPLDFIKLDVEGAEAAALSGARETLARCRPALQICCYHRSEDLFSLPLLLSEICPRYRFYLRRRRSVPAWDVDLLAVPEEN